MRSVKSWVFRMRKMPEMRLERSVSSILGAAACSSGRLSLLLESSVLRESVSSSSICWAVSLM